MHDLAAGAGQQRPDSVDDSGVTADHDRQIRCVGARHPTADRGVDHVHAALAGRGGQGLGPRRDTRAHIDDHGARLELRQHTVLTEHDPVHDVAGGQDEHNDVTVGEVGRGGRARVAGDELLLHRGVGVADQQMLACGNEIRRDRLSHRAQSDQPDGPAQRDRRGSTAGYGPLDAHDSSVLVRGPSSATRVSCTTRIADRPAGAPQ